RSPAKAGRCPRGQGRPCYRVSCGIRLQPDLSGVSGSVQHQADVDELAAEVQDDLHVVDAGRTDRVAVAAEWAGPDRFDHVAGGEPRLERLVAAARGQHVEAGLLEGRAPEDAQATADAVVEVERGHLDIA